MQTERNSSAALDPKLCNPTPRRTGKLIDWVQGYRLFVDGHSYPEIAAQLNCSVRAVIYRAQRCAWRAKRSALQARMPQEVREAGAPDVADQYLKVVEEAATYVPSELAKLKQRERVAEEQLEAERTSEKPNRLAIARLLSALDTISERRRILLGIPLPGSRRLSEKPVRGRVSSLSLDPRAVTDVMEGSGVTAP